MNVKKIGFEDVQYAVRNHQKYVIINTLVASEQDCLIARTIPASTEEDTINRLIAGMAGGGVGGFVSMLLKRGGRGAEIPIVVYGRNAADETVDAKCRALMGLGFTQVFAYSGGLFEWLMLQDIHNAAEFPTTSNLADFLRFKPNATFNVPLITW